MSERKRIFLLSTGDEESYSPTYLATWRNISAADFEKLAKKTAAEVVAAQLRAEPEPYLSMHGVVRKVRLLLLAKHGFHEFKFDGEFHTYDHHLTAFGEHPHLRAQEAAFLREMRFPKDLVRRLRRAAKLRTERERIEMTEFAKKQKKAAKPSGKKRR